MERRSAPCRPGSWRVRSVHGSALRVVGVDLRRVLQLQATDDQRGARGLAVLQRRRRQPARLLRTMLGRGIRGRRGRAAPQSRLPAMRGSSPPTAAGRLGLRRPRVDRRPEGLDRREAVCRHGRLTARKRDLFDAMFSAQATRCPETESPTGAPVVRARTRTAWVRTSIALISWPTLKSTQRSLAASAGCVSRGAPTTPRRLPERRPVRLEVAAVLRQSQPTPPSGGTRRPARAVRARHPSRRPRCSPRRAHLVERDRLPGDVEHQSFDLLCHLVLTTAGESSTRTKADDVPARSDIHEPRGDQGIRSDQAAEEG